MKHLPADQRPREKLLSKGAAALADHELLVKFKAGTTRQQAEAIIAEQGDSVIDFISAIEVFHIRIRSTQTLQQALKDYATLTQVQYAEPNLRLHTQTP